MTGGAVSYGVAFAAFLALTALLLISRQGGRHGALLLLASLLSLLWAGVGLHSALGHGVRDVGGGLADTLRILGWGVFVHSLIRLGRSSGGIAANDDSAYRPGERSTGTDGGASAGDTVATSRAADGVVLGSAPGSGLTNWRSLQRFRFAAFTVALVAAQLSLPLVATLGPSGAGIARVGLPSLWVIATLASLALVEELYRNTLAARRYAIRHLCLGLAAMFAFDFFVFTNTLLFRRIEPDLWDARGLVYALLVPLIGLSVARNRDWAVRLHVSRGAVTGSVAVLGAGAYLLATALAGTLIRGSGVSWAGIAAIAAVFLALLALLLLALSRKLRDHARVFLSKHLFNYKYDYRREWLTFTDTLARDPEDAPASILEGLMHIVESDAGALWSVATDRHSALVAARGLAGFDAIPSSALRPLVRFLDESGWLVELDEYRRHPERYGGLDLPAPIAGNSTIWLIVPLPFNDGIVGFALIARSSLMKQINWEDRDLLKTAGHQAAGLLAQRRAHEALTEARQFEAFSKLSAYIVHDLKNILGQQALIVSNAARHKHKPEFVDDAIATIENSVTRMQSLLSQLRTERGEERLEPVELTALVREAVSAALARCPAPTLGSLPDKLFVRANRDKLQRVLGHLIQNAQEATSAGGKVDVSLDRRGNGARVGIADDGRGMSEAFTRERLFKPFESTKGLTGMGIGAYESRECVRSLGGDITVESTPGRGTLFTVHLPLVQAVLVTDNTAGAADVRT